jgi:hypothetical protein
MRHSHPNALLSQYPLFPVSVVNSQPFVPTYVHCSQAKNAQNWLIGGSPLERFFSSVALGLQSTPRFRATGALLLGSTDTKA